MTRMYSSEDLEKFYFDYQTQWLPRGMSIQAYCSRNNVPYKVLNKWIRNIYKKVVPVEVTGIPEYEDRPPVSSHSQTVKSSAISDNVSINVRFSTSSGMEVSREGLDYMSFRVFIEKLEGLLC